MENETFKDRLVKFARVHYDKGMNSFESYCGINRGTINNIVKGISTTTLTPIVEKCPELNVRWLLTGEGEMLERDSAVSRDNVERCRMELDHIRMQMDNYMVQAKELTKIVAQQQEYIDTLRGYIKVLQEQNATEDER